MTAVVLLVAFVAFELLLLLLGIAVATAVVRERQGIDRGQEMILENPVDIKADNSASRGLRGAIDGRQPVQAQNWSAFKTYGLEEGT